MPVSPTIVFVFFTVLFMLFCAIITILVFRRSYHLNHLHLEQNRLINDNRKMAIQEGERMMNQISKEVHDNIGQAATMAKISLHRATLLNDNPQLGALLEDMSKQMDNIQLEVTNISHSANHDYIRGKELDTLLVDDLEFLQTNKEILTDYTVTGTVRIIPPEIKLLVYRIAQQAFSNIVKHSGATEVTVKLIYGRQRFEMRIEDNGTGIASNRLKYPNGIGLSNMRSRATEMNGELTVQTTLGKGCAIILVIPEVIFI